MYVGVRAGGGIGDEIEDPAGDEYELYRVVFDITFFFFVIVILLAIIQGMTPDLLIKSQSEFIDRRCPHSLLFPASGANLEDQSYVRRWIWIMDLWVFCQL